MLEGVSLYLLLVLAEVERLLESVVQCRHDLFQETDDQVRYLVFGV